METPRLTGRFPVRGAPYGHGLLRRVTNYWSEVLNFAL